MAESLSAERAMEDNDKADIDDYISNIVEKQVIFPKADNNMKVAQKSRKSCTHKEKGLHVEYNFKIQDKVLRRNMQQVTK